MYTGERVTGVVFSVHPALVSLDLYRSQPSSTSADSTRDLWYGHIRFLLGIRAVEKPLPILLLCRPTVGVLGDEPSC